MEISQFFFLKSGGNFYWVINLVLWSLVEFLLFVAIYYKVNQMGHKKISDISNGRVHTSDEIAEYEKVFERKDRFSLKKHQY